MRRRALWQRPDSDFLETIYICSWGHHAKRNDEIMEIREMRIRYNLVLMLMAWARPSEVSMIRRGRLIVSLVVT
jgi:hypothetical protein